MNIRFKIKTISYIVAKFDSAKSIVEIGHSGLFEDKFQDLLNVFYLIYNTVRRGKQCAILPYSSTIIWDDDFILYRWIISLDSLNAPINIKIIETYAEGSQNKLLIDENFLFQDLYNDIYLSLHEMYINFGFIGYKYNWDVGNFPICEYLLLKADKCHLNLSLKDEDDGDNEWRNKIGEEKEMSVLLLDKPLLRERKS